MGGEVVQSTQVTTKIYYNISKQNNSKFGKASDCISVQLEHAMAVTRDVQD